MKRKMVNIMTTMLLISNISMNTVYASPVLEPAPAPDMSITTEAENNSKTTEETNEHDTSDMPNSNDGFHDRSEGISDDGNEGYGLLEDVGGGLEETSSYINLGILRLDSFLVKNMDGDYALKDYYAKIDEIIDYAKKKTKIKYFNSNSDENISNSLNKTLRGIEYDEEKNIFYMDLEKSDRDYDSTYSKKNRTNDEKLYRVYFKFLNNINIKYNPNIDEINEEGFYDAGTVKINKNLDAKTYKKIISKDYGFGPKIDNDTDTQIRNALKEKLNTENDIVPKNWQDRNLKYDIDKQKFYLEYLEKSTNPEDEKLYRFYFIGTNKDYEFSDEHDTKLDLTDKKNLDIVLAFIKQEYENVKDIKLNNKNILTENNKNYLDVKVTEDDGTEHDAKIFLKPTTMRPNEDVKDIYINIDVYSEEISNMKLSKETIKQVNDILNKKINNNVLYRDEYFVLNDNNIYKDDYERYYINIYDTKRKSNQKIYISIKDNLKADLLLEDENNNFDINDLKISEYKCNQYHKNNIYLSKNGEIPILDYINSKLSNGLYADNLRLERFDNKIVADVKDKNTHEKKSNFIIGYNRFNNDEEKLFFMNNINNDLILTEKNKKDLEKLIRNTENVNIKNIEFKENFEKETKNIDGETINYYTINVTIHFENNSSQTKTYNIVVDSHYQDDNVFYGLKGMVKPGIPKPPCGDQESMNYNSPPAYGGKTYDGKYTKVKIKIPSADDFPDVTPCDPKPDPKVTPSDLPKPKPENPVTHSDLQKPKPNNPNTPTPKESTPRIPNEVVGKIPNEVIEKTPITIISNEKKQSVNGESREIENTTGLPNIARKEIKTGDNLFNIIYLIGTFGIFAYFISLLKNKYKHKLN